MRLRSASLIAFGAVIAFSACFPRGRSSQPIIDNRDLAIYTAVAESLYLGRANGRPVAIVNRTLDTMCVSSACPPLAKRWGLDSLWWAREDATLARRIRDVLLTRAGRSLAWGPNGSGNPRIVLVDSTAPPAPGASVEAWRAFQNSIAVAALEFSPVGFSPDGSRALVVVRMRCGPRCGHWLTASLTSQGNGWKVGELLLVSSDG